ncbi:MAG TPA: glycosyl hydrolase [Polyangiaceae bacterium]|nr:glycosyl hydrolase [Polyangiaceae bacterium]
MSLVRAVSWISLSACFLALTACDNGDGSDPDSSGAGAPGDAGASGGAPGAGGSGDGTGGSPLPPGTDWQLNDATPPASSQPRWPTLSNPVQPTAFWGDRQGPRPTNTWWLNLVLGDGTAAAFPFPFTVSWSNDGLTFGHPAIDAQANAVFAPLHQSVLVGATQAFTSRVVDAYDELSVTLAFRAASGAMKVPVVAGSPYLTAVYEGLTPELALPISGSGERFEVSQGGVNYVVYASSSLTFNAGVSSAPFSGTLRIAKVPNPGTLALLDEHAAAIVYGGHAGFSSAGTTGILRLDFDTHGTGTPLMLALPHQLERVRDKATLERDYVLSTLKGSAKALSASSWDLEYPMTGVGFTAPTAIDPAMVDQLKAALAADAGYDPAAQNDPSVYWSGKALSKLARLIQIADELGETGTRDTLLARLASKEKAWLDGTTSGTHLAYDTTWGGVVNACVTDSVDCDFGQGKYSDHHFHYGYHVFAAAVLAKYDAAFASEYAQKVEWLIRDYANPYAGDPKFARLRHFDVYHGHSWTSGLYVFGDGRNQESTSEAVHAYYGVQLWGAATGNEDYEKVGHILRIAESVGAQRYWHVKDASIYPAPFSSHPCVGIVWGSKVDYATWFGMGDNQEFVCGIQMIPVTPATEDLLDKAWLDARWADGLGPIANALSPSNGWRDFFAAALANRDRTAGCAMIASQTAHDDGNSKTNMLHYCATRPR